MRRYALIFFGLWLTCPGPAHAELPTLRFLKLIPLGANAGSEIEVDAGGAEFDTVDTLLFDHPGLKATFLRPLRFKIEVAADVPAGTYDVWGVGKYGISNPRLFAVSRGLTDVAEKAPNNSSAQAQQVGVNTAINGLTTPTGDFFRFEANRGQRLTFDCFAQRLLTIDSRGITAEIALSLFTANGRRLAGNSHYYGNDPLLDYIFADEGSYILRVDELNYAQGNAYRLVISDRPHLENVFPRAIEPDRPTEVTVFGRNLGPGSKLTSWQIDGPPLEERTLTVDLRSAADSLGFQFTEHPTGLACPVTCSTVRLRGTQLRPDWNGGALNAVSVMRAWITPTSETELNDTREQAQNVPRAALIDARFDHVGDVDWYQVDVPPGQEGKYTLQVYCERLGGRADPYVKVEDDKGNRLVEFDDQSFGGTADGRNRDPFGQLDLAAKRYHIMVKDLHGRGGARCQYILSLRKTEPEFCAMTWAPHTTLGGVGNCCGVTIRRGGSAFVLVAAVHEGVPCPVDVMAEDLPPGLHAAPCSLRAAPNATGAVVLWADSDAPDWAGPIRFKATAQVNGQLIERPVTPCTFADATNGGRPTRSMMAAIRDSSPFSLRVVPDKITVAAGGKAELKFVAARQWPDCTGRIEIQNTQNSTLTLVIPNQAISAGATETSCVVEIPKQALPGTYTICFQGSAIVPLTRVIEGAQKTEEVTAREPTLPVAITISAVGK